MSRPRFSCPMTKAETVFGWIFLFLQQLLIIPVAWLLEKAGIHLSTAWLNIVFFVMNFLIIAVGMQKFLRTDLRHFGKHFLYCLGIATVGFAVYWAANMLVSIAIVLYWPEFTNANDANLAAMSKECYWVFLACTVFLVPITEEVLFRGILFGSVHKYSPVVAYIFSAMIFSAIHVVPYLGSDGFTLKTALVSMIQYLPPSLCLAWVYEKSGTIFVPALVHCAVNLIGVLAMR